MGQLFSGGQVDDKIKAAGILPVALHRGNLYFLLGESVDGLWGDFGGIREKGETVMETAKREGTEELSGLIGDLDKRLEWAFELKCDRYISYIIPIKYNAGLPKRFSPNDEIENVEWVPIENIEHLKFRFPKFRKMIEQSVEDIEIICKGS